MDSIKGLLNIINSGISDIESTYAKEGVTFPSLDDTYTGPSEVAMKTAEVTDNIVSAALQLVATLRDPVITCLLTSGAVRNIRVNPFI
jgi:hypothetical protein